MSNGREFRNFKYENFHPSEHNSTRHFVIVDFTHLKFDIEKNQIACIEKVIYFRMLFEWRITRIAE